MRSKVLLVASAIFLLSACDQNSPGSPSHGANTDGEDPIKHAEDQIAATQDPAKVALMECMGVQVYEDPQPPGHPASIAECARIFSKFPKPAPAKPDKITTADGFTTVWHTNAGDADFCHELGVAIAMRAAASTLARTEDVEIQSVEAGRSFCESNAPGECTADKIAKGHVCHATVVVGGGHAGTVPGNFYIDEAGTVGSFEPDAQRLANGFVEH